MAGRSDDKLLNLFEQAFHEVVAPILEEHSRILNEHTKILNEHTKILEEHSSRLDAHTASLMELEKMPKLLGEIYNEVKGQRSSLVDHEERITSLEGVVRP